MRIALTAPVIAFDLVFGPDRVQVRPPEGSYSIAIRGSLSQLAALARARPEDTQKVAASGLKMEGEIDVALAVKRFFEAARPDWEEMLARAFGDIAGHQLARSVKGLGRFLTYATNQIAGNAVTFLQDETHSLPRPWEVDQFLSAVDTLRDDAGRLEDRLRRLKARGC